jgi:hypothetical protein
MFRRRLLVSGGVLVSTYACSLVYRSLSPALPRVPFTDPDPKFVPRSTSERMEVFEHVAPKYDRAMRFNEWMFGTKAYRKALLQHARGKGELLRSNVYCAAGCTCFQLTI